MLSTFLNDISEVRFPGNNATTNAVDLVTNIRKITEKLLLRFVYNFTGIEKTVILAAVAVDESFLGLDC